MAPAKAIAVKAISIDFILFSQVYFLGRMLPPKQPPKPALMSL
jgi:hypothetical protein